MDTLLKKTTLICSCVFNASVFNTEHLFFFLKHLLNFPSLFCATLHPSSGRGRASIFNLAADSTLLTAGKRAETAHTCCLAAALKVKARRSSSFVACIRSRGPCCGVQSRGKSSTEEDMDPMKAQQLAAELEVEMMADMYNR